MKINILSPGRFHVCDLARELAAHGHQVRFYSYVPKSRTTKFGLPKECARPVLSWVLLPLVLTRITSGTFLENLANDFLIWWMDLVVFWAMEPCDIVIAMSGCFNRSVEKAKTKWSAKILIERGSRHILSQKEILDEVKKLHPQVRTVPDSAVQRELKDYQIADRIIVPSRHVFESFIERGISKEKIFRNSYGVDLSRFVPTECSEGHQTLLMVGTWCYRKGCDLLIEAVKGTSYRLLHAGTIGDCPFPKEENFLDLGFVDQNCLKSIYAQAHVFVLPSREEGLALVQAQALACGLSLVCSDRTGGEDLRGFCDDKSRVIVVKNNDVNALRKAIKKALKSIRKQKGIRRISGFSLKKMSWKAYGERYHRFLRNWLEKVETA